MPARTIVGLPTSLRLTLSNDKEQLDTQLAADGAHAIKVAILMLASREELRHGDVLMVQLAGEDSGITVLRGRQR